MALIIDEDLKPKPKAVSLPALISFTVSLRDNQAPENPTSTKPLPVHHLVMSLDPDNDLFFVVGGNRRKEAEFAEPIPRKSKESHLSIASPRRRRRPRVFRGRARRARTERDGLFG
jgi:hypothetical protein